MALSSPLGKGDAVLFDMDGTLLFLPVDIDGLRGRLERYHQRYGLQMSFRPLTDDLETAAVRLREQLSPAEARAAISWAHAEVRQAEVDAAAQARPRPGVIDALHALQERGVTIGVVSNNTRRGIQAGLAAVGIDAQALAAVVSREDVPRPKPAPDSMEKAIAELIVGGWQPDLGRLLVVGDAPSDLLAARAIAPTRGVCPLVVIVGGGLAGSGSLVGPDVDHLVSNDQEAYELLIG